MLLNSHNSEIKQPTSEFCITKGNVQQRFNRTTEVIFNNTGRTCEKIFYFGMARFGNFTGTFGIEISVLTPKDWGYRQRNCRGLTEVVESGQYW